MEPILINVEVGLKESTLKVLQGLVGAAVLAAAGAPKAAKAEPVAEPETAPAPTVEDTPLEVVDDLPITPEPVEPRVISDLELGEAVKAAQARLRAKGEPKAAAVVKAIFAEYGIECSSQCPKDRREALLNRINQLGV